MDEEVSYTHLFVIGLPRSGTSLLFKTINSHPNVSLLYESDTFYSWPKWLSAIRAKSWGERLDLWNGHLSRHGFGEQLGEFPPSNRKEAMEHLCELQAEKGAVVVGEKSALYGCYLDELYANFPKAKFIILWRELEEVFDSVKRAAASGDSYFSTRGLFYEYLGDMDRMARGVSSIRNDGATVMEVDFEDLVSQREGVSRNICEFLGIEFSDEMVTARNFDNGVIPTGNHHAGVKHGNIEQAGRGEMVTAKWLSRVKRFKNARMGSDGERPSAFERSICFIGYKLAKVRLQAKVLVYWFLPQSIISAYRKSRS